MNLQELLDTWYLRERKVKSQSANALRRAINSLSEFLGSNAATDDLTDQNVTDWIMWMEDRYAPRTVYGYRSSVMTVWKYAAEAELAKPPCRVRKARKPQPSPVAWTEGEWRKVLAAADRYPGTFPKADILYCDYFGTLLRCAYDTGLRRGDLFKLRQSCVNQDGRIRMRQEKTGDPHFPMLRSETLRRFRSLPGAYPLAWRGNVSGMYYHFGRLRRAAGVPSGALHQTRRTGATMVMRHTESVETTKKYLGHRSQDMWRAYVDMAVADTNPVLPPEIG